MLSSFSSFKLHWIKILKAICWLLASEDARENSRAKKRWSFRERARNTEWLDLRKLQWAASYHRAFTSSVREVCILLLTNTLRTSDRAEMAVLLRSKSNFSIFTLATFSWERLGNRLNHRETIYFDQLEVRSAKMIHTDRMIFYVRHNW